MSARHSNISIFVPHIGCPNMCSFCNQRHITGIHYAPHASDVINAVKAATTSNKYDPQTTEIAFFGGSFTAINRNYMIELLRTAHAFVQNGIVSGIRISTRPDAIDETVLGILKEYKVTAIEKNAFKNQKKATKITIGKNVTKIGATAFTNCTKLKSIKIQATKLTKSGLAKTAFKGVKNSVKISVPGSKVKTYKTLFKKAGLNSKVKVTK